MLRTMTNRPQLRTLTTSLVRAFHQSSATLSKDIREARFTISSKQMNPSPAQQLISAVPPIQVSKRVVQCSGGTDGTGGALGHPRVFINLDKPGPQPCDYCGLRFEKVGHHH